MWCTYSFLQALKTECVGFDFAGVCNAARVQECTDYSGHDQSNVQAWTIAADCSHLKCGSKLQNGSRVFLAVSSQEHSIPRVIAIGKTLGDPEGHVQVEAHRPWFPVAVQVECTTHSFFKPALSSFVGGKMLHWIVKRSGINEPELPDMDTLSGISEVSDGKSSSILIFYISDLNLYFIRGMK